MKPYYVLSLLGALDENETPEKFGLLPAESPEQAEDFVLKISAIHDPSKDVVTLAVLQLYRSYPGTLLRTLETGRRDLAAAKQKAQEDKQKIEEGSKFRATLSAEVTRLRAEKSTLAAELLELHEAKTDARRRASAKRARKAKSAKAKEG
jgi:hypothetical protein